MKETIVTIIKDPLFVSSFSGANPYQTVVIFTEKEWVFEKEVEVVKKLVCLETEKEYKVPMFLTAECARNYVQTLVGTLEGTTAKKKNLN